MAAMRPGGGSGEPFRGQRRKAMTFRVSDVPPDWDLEALHAFLIAYDDSFDTVLRNLSTIAPELDGASSTATLTFVAIPVPLSRATIDGRCSWQYPEPIVSRAGPKAVSYWLAIDNDFIGLTTLHAPPDEMHEVNIIAVSGLGGHAFGSFKEKDGNYMWLRDKLHQTDHSSARIMTYGHKSTVAGSRNLAGLDDLSTELYGQLVLLCNGPEAIRPIIFIGHSLGGLIVKQMIVNLWSSRSQEDKTILAAIYGLLFFGVPQRGMSNKSLVSMAGDGPNRILIDSLSSDLSFALTYQERFFLDALGGEGESEMFCFYETELSPTAIKRDNGWKMEGPEECLVSKASATSSRPWERDATHIYGMHRNHSNLVKFSPRDADLKFVSRKLKDMTRRCLDRGQGRQVPFKRASETQTFTRDYTTRNQTTRHILLKPENKNFVGRGMEIDQLRRMFFEQNFRDVAIWGLGGVGKTELALAFSYWITRNKPEYSVYWVSAASIVAFRESCYDLATTLGLLDHDQTVDFDPISEIQKYLVSENVGPWFMIVDDANDPGVIDETIDGSIPSVLSTLPSGSGRRYLYTSRLGSTASLCVHRRHLLELHCLKPQPACRLLKDLVNAEHLVQDSSAVDQLVEELGYLPQAILEAAAEIKGGKIAVETYIERLEESRTLLLKAEYPQKCLTALKTVAITWYSSFDTLHRVDKSPLELLQFMSFLEPKTIPLQALHRPNWKRFIEVLEDHGFLARRDIEVLDIHPLVHFSVQLWMRQNHYQNGSFASTIRRFVDMFHENGISSQYWEDTEKEHAPFEGQGRLLPHVHRLVTHDYPSATETRNGQIELMLNVSNLLMRNGQLVRGIQCLRVALTWKHVQKDPSSQIWIATLWAKLCYAGGYYAEATANMHRAVLQYKNWSEDAIDATEWLVDCFFMHGCFDQAAKSMQYMLDSQTEPSSNRQIRVLAKCLWKSGAPISEVLSLIENEVAAQKKRAPNALDFELLETQSRLGEILVDTDRRRAIEILQQVLATRETAEEGDLRDVLCDRLLLANALIANGERELAVSIFEAAVKYVRLPQGAVKEIQNNFSPDLLIELRILLQLAKEYHSEDNPRATKLLEEIVPVFKHTFADDLSWSLEAQRYLAMNLGRKQGKQDDIERAIELFEWVDSVLARPPAKDRRDYRTAEEVAKQSGEVSAQRAEIKRWLKSLRSSDASPPVADTSPPVKSDEAAQDHAQPTPAAKPPTTERSKLAARYAKMFQSFVTDEEEEQAATS